MRREKVLFSGVGELFSVVNSRQANETPTCMHIWDCLIPDLNH